MATTTAASAQKNAALILADYQVQKTKLLQGAATVVDPYDSKDPPRHVRNFKQDSEDTQADSPQTARDVGNLTRGKTRLNIISALTKGDKVDFFKFNATEQENFGISVKTDQNVHIQILNAQGRVIADSEAKYGDKFDNFEKAGKQALRLDRGQYFIKVTRSTGDLEDVKPNYAIQLSSTKYFEEDYDTIEKPAPKTSYAAVYAQNSGGINSLLTQVYGGAFDFGNGSYYSKKV